MAATAKKPELMDAWSIREKTALSCSVKRSGDNNWVSVSRAVKPYGESNRPTDWFSQKNCALQYSDLLEKLETPKRKRGERELAVEPPGDTLVRRMTIERIEELKKIIQEEQKRYKKLKEEIELTSAGHADDKLTELWEEVEQEKAEEVEREKAWTEKMAARELAMLKGKKLVSGTKVKVEADESMPDSVTDTISMEEDSNLSQPSVSTPLSTTSQDVKPTLTPTVLTLDQSMNESLGSQGASDTASKAHTFEEDGQTKTETKDELILAADIKTEPGEVDILSTPAIKEEVIETEEITMEPLPDHVDTADKTDMSEDDTSTIGRDETRSEQGELEKTQLEHETENDVFVQVVDDKDDKSVDAMESVSDGPSKDDEPPLSPSSSIMSNDTDGGSFTRGKGRSRRGGKIRSSRRRHRYGPSKLMDSDDKMKGSETSSKAESSDDDDVVDTTLPESDDTASNATGRLHLSFTESVPNSPASIAPGDTEDEKAHKVWKKSIMLVWRAASNHKYANVFSHPVTEEIAPGYHSVVHRPLDLSVVKKNIESGQIRCTAEFQRDMMLMFTNAIMYNNCDHDVFHMATEMYDDVMRHIEQYVHTQIMVQGGDTKLLRTSRRSEVISDKPEQEDDPKRKRQIGTPSEQDGGKTKKRKTTI